MSRLREVVDRLTEERDITPEELCEEIQALGYHVGDAMDVIQGNIEACTEFVPVLTLILTLNRDERHELIDALLADERARKDAA